MKRADKKAQDGQDLLNAVKAKEVVDAIEAHLVASGHTVNRLDLFGESKDTGITCVDNELVDLRVTTDNSSHLRLSFGFPSRRQYSEPPKKGFNTVKIVADILEYLAKVKAEIEEGTQKALALMHHQETAHRINTDLAFDTNRVKATEQGLEVRTAPLTETQARAVLIVLKELSDKSNAAIVGWSSQRPR